jgi:outer membrane protein TolC
MQARDQLTQVKTTVVQKLTTTIDQLRNAIRKLEFLRSNQAVLEDSLEAANRRYQSQLVSEFELLEVQKDLLNLKRNRLEIMVNLRKNYSLFLALQNKINRSDFQLN